MSKITHFDKATVQKLRVILDEAVKSIKDNYGIVVNVGNMRYSPDSVTIKCEALLDNGSGMDAYEQSLQKNVKIYGGLFGINESMIGKKANIPDRGMCTLL